MKLRKTVRKIIFKTKVWQRFQREFLASIIGAMRNIFYPILIFCLTVRILAIISR